VGSNREGDGSKDGIGKAHGIRPVLSENFIRSGYCRTDHRIILTDVFDHACAENVGRQSVQVAAAVFTENFIQ
jgi:hypothetical protein